MANAATARPDTQAVHALDVPLPAPAGTFGALLGEYGLVDAGDRDAAMADLLYRLDNHSEDGARGRAESDPSAPARTPTLTWLFALVFFFAFKLGLIIAPRLELYLALVCAEIGIETHAHVPSSACRTSPEAQRALSSLTLYILLGVGVFSALSAGFWTSVSDRFGRIPVMVATLLGIAFMDVAVLTAAYIKPELLPFGTSFLAIGGIVEGMCGGYAIFTSMMQCYVSDVTTSGSRSHQFSVGTGALFAGISAGPLVGGLITAVWHNPLVTLWVGAVTHVLLVFATLCVPESLSRASREAAQREHAATHDAGVRSLAEFAYATLSAPLRSLSVLQPIRIEAYERVATEEMGEEPFSVSHTSSGKWNANLLLLSIAFFAEATCQAIVPFSLQYTQLVFNWNSAAMSYYMTFSSTLRVAALGFIIPMFIRLVHRQSSSTRTTGDAPAQPAGTSMQEHTAKLWEQRTRQVSLIRDSRFDRKLAVYSAVLSAIANFLLGVVTTPGSFLALMVLVAIGAGVSSALNSLSLALLVRPQDAGRLFGAWAVLGTVASALIGPPLFTVVFRETVAIFPSAIFMAAAVLQVVAAAVLLLIRLRHESTVAMPDST